MEENISCMEEECLIEKRRTTILKECKELLREEGSGRYSREAFRRFFQNQVILRKLFILFDQDRDELLKQEKWIEFLKGRLTNEKQKDFIDQIESVAYVLCGENPVNFSNFQQIFYTKGIVDKLFRLIDRENSEYITSAQIMEFISGVSNTRPPAGFDKNSLECLEKIFKQTVGNEEEIRLEEFKKIVTSKNPFFTERVFQIFDKDNSGTISLQEFLDAMNEFVGKSLDDKIRFLFKVYDIDGDGLIQLHELNHVMRACMEESGMTFSNEQIEDLTRALFEDVDQKDRRGAITFEALKRQLEKHDGLPENFSISIDRWLVPPQPKPKRTSMLSALPSLCPHQLTKQYLKNNYIFVTFVLITILINVVLIVYRFYEYRNHDGSLMIARAAGLCLCLNCSLLLLMTLRESIAYLRTRRCTRILPLDQHIYLHKMLGVWIGVLSITHAVAHFVYWATVITKDESINSGNYTMFEWFLTTRPGHFGLVEGIAYPTGVILLVILFVMTFCSMPFVRRSGCFEVFYWSHMLHVPFWIVTILHCPHFWQWFLVPGLIHFVENIRRWRRVHSEHGKTYISSGLLLPSRVIQLVIKRPLDFQFNPGDYVFLNIPTIARYEWHPFTISSAPEQEDYLWVHIRAVGGWTDSLYSYFEKKQMTLLRGDIPSNENSVTEDNVPRKKSFLNEKTLPVIVEPESVACSGIDNPTFELPPTFNLSVSSMSPAHTSTPNQSGSSKKCSFSPEVVLELNKEWTSVPAIRDRRLRQLLRSDKTPLEKSHSMPNMRTNSKKDRLRILHDYARSESERNFDEREMRRARLKSLNVAYLSPQNRSLAQSFRYLRTKPTIIAFKTPSLETYDEIGADTTAVKTTRSPSPREGEAMPTTSVDTQVAAEEGRLEKVYEAANGSLNPKSLDSSRPSLNYPVGKPLEIYVDGPYGAPSNHIFQAQHAVLIAAGIGVTPFSSILQSIMHRYWKAKHTCPKCSFSWTAEIPSTIMKLRKVDFFWINRDQHSFEWFVQLLSKLEMEQAEFGGTMERFLEMHMYITSALQKHDMKAVGLQLALELLHKKKDQDLITGLRTRTNAGRPNWERVFKQLENHKKGKITVFYCGPPELGKNLRLKCDQFGFHFKKESF